MRRNAKLEDKKALEASSPSCPISPLLQSRGHSVIVISRDYTKTKYILINDLDLDRTIITHTSLEPFSLSLFCGFGFCNLIFGKACSDLYDTIHTASLVIERK